MRPGALGRIHLTVLLVYLLLAVLLTWPTAIHVNSHLPGDGGDDPAIAWNLWWVKHALLDLRTNPLFSDYMFYPIGVNLAFYTLTVLNAFTALPLTLTLGVTTASNLHLWFTIVVGGYGTFLLARYLLASSFPRETPGGRENVWAAALAGGFSTFASSQLFYVSLGQFNIASSHWVPYTILFVFKSRHDLSSLRWPALAALFLTLQAWTEMTYASFLILFIALYTAYEIITHLGSRITYHASRFGRLKLVARNLILLTLLFTLGISPLLAAMLPDMRVEGDFWVQGSGFAEVFSADLFGFLVPTMRHPVFGELVSRTGMVDFDKGQHIYLGFTLLALATIGVVVGARRTSPRHLRFWTWFWLIAALSFAWLSLGPTIHINGRDTGIPGPFVILQSLPFFKGNRYPSRYSVLLVLSLAMPGAYAVVFIWQHVSKWQGGGRPRLVQSPGAQHPEHVEGCGQGDESSQTRLLRQAQDASLGLSSDFARALGGRHGGSTGRGWGRVAFLAFPWLLALLFLFEHLSIPLPQSDMTIPAPYDIVAADRGEFTLLDIPVAWRNGFRITGPIDPEFMFGQFYQTRHQRRMLQGNTSRNPEFDFQYFTQAPVINSILALETGHELPSELWEADRTVAGDVLRFFDIKYIVVRPGHGDDPAVTPEATLPYIESVMPVERIYRDPDISIYRVNPPPLPEQVQIAASQPLARLYFGQGWGAIPDRRLDEADQRVWAQRRDVRLLVPLDGRSQEVTLRLFSPGQGQRLVISADGWRSAPLALEPGWGEYSVALPAGAAQAGLNQIRLSFDQVYPVASLALAEETPALLVQSAGQEVGDFGHIYLNGVDVSPNQRGYNLAVISPQGDILTAGFDSHLDPGASKAMAEFIAAVPSGHTVAVAVADEASMNLGEEAVAALRSVGATGDLRGRFRWGHAIIGVKGAAPGSALEVLDGLRPVSVADGPPLTEPGVAAAVGWIRFEASEQ